MPSLHFMSHHARGVVCVPSKAKVRLGARNVFALRICPLDESSECGLFSEVARHTGSKSVKMVRLFSLSQIEGIYNWHPYSNMLLALMVILPFHGLYRDEH